MSARKKYDHEGEVYRWSDDCRDIEFKCGSCGHWKTDDKTSGPSAGENPLCRECADLLFDALGEKK